MDWSVYRTALSERWAHARAAWANGAGAQVLGGWRFAGQPKLLAVLWSALQESALTVDAGLANALSGEGNVRAPSPRSQRPYQHHLHAHRGAKRSETPTDGAVWALAELSFYGEQVEARERGLWREETYEPSDDDAEVARLWLAWLGGAALWEGREAWDSRFTGPAAQAFRHVLASRSVPMEARHRVLDDLREGFWFQLLGGRDTVPGWKELAARTLETAGPSPAQALLGHLHGHGWRRAEQCVSQRGYWPDTLRQLLPDVPGSEARALALRTVLNGEPPTAEALVDLHIALRLIDSWQDPRAADPARAWSVVVQNQGRALGRLRALVSESDPAELAGAVAALPGVRARTEAAVRRWAWSWAWGVLARGLVLDFTEPASPPCELDDARLEPLDSSEAEIARTWVLLVVLKGRLDHLERWTRTGGTGDRDGTWGRLLHTELPDALRDPSDAAARSGSYHRLRAWLSGGLGDSLAAWRPTLVRLAALPEGRGLKGRFNEAVDAEWNADVPRPRSGFPTFCRHAREALSELDQRGPA